MSTIIIKNEKRILIKENNERVNINDGDIIRYTGNYYKNNIIVKTDFIGVVETHRYRHETGIEGIYVNPLYIWDWVNNEWCVVINLHPPKTKYFLYPHLLVLSQYYNFCCYNPIDSLNTCENKSLSDFADIEKTFNL